MKEIPLIELAKVAWKEGKQHLVRIYYINRVRVLNKQWAKEKAAIRVAAK